MAEYEFDVERFIFRSWEEEDRANMGGYTFPILNDFGDYAVVMYPLPNTPEELTHIRKLATGDNVVFSYVDGGKIVIVRGDFSLEDMGLSALTSDDTTSKTVKRLKTLARPFRIHTKREGGLRIRLVEGDKELDGAFVVSRDLYREACGNIRLPGFHPVQQAQLIRSMDNKPIHNFRGVGKFTDADTGEELFGFAKGNVVVSELPDGVDMILTADNFKHEVINSGGDLAWALFEPQGPKEAWEDQQTICNQPFLLSVPEGRTRMVEATNTYLEELTSGKVMSTMEELSKTEFRTDYAYDGDTFARLLRWNAHKWALHGLSYTLSPWLTERLGISYLKSFAIEDRRRTRIPIPGAIRAQIITVALAKLAGVNIEVPPGEITWVPRLGAAVVNDAHWVHQMMETHGGCDLDDFFVLRRDGDRCIVTRSPNARGEYTVFDRVNRWWPGSEKSRPITRTTWPTQILDALGSGETSYIPMPSEVNEVPKGAKRLYTNEDALIALDEALTVEGGYGQYELAVRSWYSLTYAQHLPAAIPSEAAVDAFTQGGTAEDRNFILSQAERIIEMIISTGRGLDPLLQGRLPREAQKLVPVDSDGPLMHLKSVQMEAEKAFMEKLRRFTQTIEVPEFLSDIGNNELLGDATKVLKQARFAMYAADQMDLKQADVLNEGINASFLDQRTGAEKSVNFAGFRNIMESVDGLPRHLFAMAFWYACRTVPTRAGRVSDQPVFGTIMLDYLLDALVYFGVALKPEVTEEGHIVRSNTVHYQENAKRFNVECVSCHTGYLGLSRTGLESYHTNGGVCKTCRG